MFYDDGEGFIDLGLDNVYEFDEDGALKGEYDGTWLAINGQPVAYYHMSTVGELHHHRPGACAPQRPALRADSGL